MFEALNEAWTYFWDYILSLFNTARSNSLAPDERALAREAQALERQEAKAVGNGDRIAKYVFTLLRKQAEVQAQASVARRNIKAKYVEAHTAALQKNPTLEAALNREAELMGTQLQRLLDRIAWYDGKIQEYSASRDRATQLILEFRALVQDRILSHDEVLAEKGFELMDRDFLRLERELAGVFSSPQSSRAYQRVRREVDDLRDTNQGMRYVNRTLMDAAGKTLFGQRPEMVEDTDKLLAEIRAEAGYTHAPSSQTQILPTDEEKGKEASSNSNNP